MTVTLSPFFIKASSFSNTVNSASIPLVSRIVQNISDVLAGLKVFEKRLATTPSKGATSVACSISLFANSYWDFDWSYPLFTLAIFIMSAGTLLKSSTEYPCPINISFSSSSAFNKAFSDWDSFCSKRNLSNSTSFCPLCTRSPFFT